MKRQAVATLLLCTMCIVSFLGLKSALVIQEREPFASPLDSPNMDTYVRTKRHQNTTSSVMLPSVKEVRDKLMQAKQQCILDMGMSQQEMDKILILEPNLNADQKCLVECVLKRTELMDKNNKLSTRSIGHMADRISNGNRLVVSIAMGAAELCNKLINTHNSCEAAHQISKCISREIHAHKLKILY